MLASPNHLFWATSHAQHLPHWQRAGTVANRWLLLTHSIKHLTVFLLGDAEG